jgi:glycosyltransferase involved in cell wall biosynthesis
MDNPLISVIIPVYNSEKYLERALDSVLNQTYKDLEIIVVDDGSTDGSGKIIAKYQKKDPRIISIRQKNSGQAAARNAGIRLAKGEFLTFLDGDDAYDKDFILKLLNGFDDGDIDIAVSGMLYCRVKEKTKKPVYVKKIRNRLPGESIKTYLVYLLSVDGAMYAVINKMFRTELIKKSKLQFSEGLYFGEDTRFVMDYLEVMSGQIHFVREPLYIYYSGNISSTMKKSGIEKKNWNDLYHDVKVWVGRPSIRGRFWLKMLALRWKISYHRTKKRANS